MLNVKFFIMKTQNENKSVKMLKCMDLQKVRGGSDKRNENIPQE